VHLILRRHQLSKTLRIEYFESEKTHGLIFTQALIFWSYWGIRNSLLAAGSYFKKNFGFFKEDLKAAISYQGFLLLAWPTFASTYISLNLS